MNSMFDGKFNGAERPLLLKELAIRLAIFLTVPVLISLGALFYLRTLFLTPPNPSDTETVIFEVAPDKSFRQMAKELEEKGLVKKAWAASTLARMRGVDTSIKAGEYEVNKGMNVIQLLNKLASGEVLRRTVSMPEGTTLAQIGPLVEAAGLMGKEEFERALRDRDLLKTAGIPSDSFEGYLFPNTYYFSKPIQARDIIWTMLQEGENRWKPEYSELADRLGMSRHEILTLASIIEKESGNVEEQKLISSVFHNRLKQNMRLQSDPTVIYGIPRFNGDLTREDLRNPHRYNTYEHHGLPPGPICNPGMSAIEATLSPDQTAYLYFVSNGQGAHVFATNLQDHNANVVKFQKQPFIEEEEEEPEMKRSRERRG
jgi:UPF0755 protein